MQAPEPSAALAFLLGQVVDALTHFQPAFGATIFLDRMLGKNGVLVNRLITLIAESEGELLATRQAAMLFAFEKLIGPRGG